MDRFTVTYRIIADNQTDAEAKAAAIALEDTLEIPRDVVPPGYIEDVVLGRVEVVSEDSDGSFRATIGYHIDAVGRELPQMVNVIFGNASILKGVKVVDLTFNDDVRERFPGARFGTEGLRKLTGRERGGYVCPVIKPQGSSTKFLANLCYLTARAGADIIKEDHGLANQDRAPFRKRVRLSAQAVARANAERAEEGDTSHALYLVNILGHPDRVRDDALYARQEGADGVLIIPGIMGFDAIARLAADPEFNLPIMAHPSHLGPYVLAPDTGYSHAVLFGSMMRLAGADISVFPNHGGRFGFSVAECQSIVDACGDPNGHGPAILPSPGGGMTLERLPDMMAMYGEDCVYLLGGGLLRFCDAVGDAIRQMRDALATNQQ